MREPERRMVVSVDMERYSRRTNTQQYEAQRAFREVLHEAAVHAGLDRAGWRIQQAGDGEMAILPRDIPETAVTGRFVPELNRLLRAYNSSRIAQARVRMRVAVHQGLVHLDGENGFPGSAVNGVARLCDAAPLKTALRKYPDAGVALIVSDQIYRDVVWEYAGELRPERFKRVQVVHPDKGFREWAWICVVDEDVTGTSVRAGDTGPGPDRAAGASGAARGRHPSGPRADGAVRDIWMSGGQNAVGDGAMAIGSVDSTGDVTFGGRWS